MTQDGNEFAVTARWTEHRKIIGDELTPVEVSQAWKMYGSAKAAALTGAAARLRDLQGIETVSDPVAMVLHRYSRRGPEDSAATPGPWSVLTELYDSGLTIDS